MAKTMTNATNADDLIRLLDLQPHPEGGHYRQTWVASKTGDRPSGTAIYFLLKETEVSHWHRIDAAEIWHFYAGAPLVLSISKTKEGPATDLMLGSDLLQGEQPQLVVPAENWQMARSTGSWSLVGCTVSPGFRFEDFELADPGFDIPRADRL